MINFFESIKYQPKGQPDQKECFYGALVLNTQRLSERLRSLCTGPLNGFGTFRRRSAPLSTSFTAAPSPSGLALPAALVHTAHLLEKISERRLSAKAFSSRTNASYQMCGRRRRVSAASAFVLLCGRGAATAFCPVCGWAKRPWTFGWLDDGRMLCRKMGWGSPTRRSRLLLLHHPHPIISPSR